MEKIQKATHSTESPSSRWWPRPPVPLDDPLRTTSERVLDTVRSLTVAPAPFLRDVTDQGPRGAELLWLGSVGLFGLGQGMFATTVAFGLGSRVSFGVAALEMVLLFMALALAWTALQMLACTRRRLRRRPVLLSQVPLLWGSIPVVGGALALGLCIRNTYLLLRHRAQAGRWESAARAGLPILMLMALGGVGGWLLG